MQNKGTCPAFDLSGKVAVITGGTKGIGLAIAQMFAHFGAKVVVSSRHQKDCEETAAQINKLCGQQSGNETVLSQPQIAAGVAGDAGVVDDVRHLIEETVRIFGDLNIMVNCAGIAITKPILEMNEEEYDQVMNTNLKSVFFGSQAAAAVMEEKGHGGKIIQIASIGGLKGTNCISTYCASKAAVLNLTKTMAIEWSRYGIETTAICPGYVKTAINAEVFENEEYLKKVLKEIPQRRLGTVEEVAAIALFLASDYSGMINGSAIIADMGATAL